MRFHITAETYTTFDESYFWEGTATFKANGNIHQIPVVAEALEYDTAVRNGMALLKAKCESVASFHGKLATFTGKKALTEHAEAITRSQEYAEVMAVLGAGLSVNDLALQI